MRRAGERRRQLRVEIAVRRIELGLGEKDAAGEVGAAEVGASEVRPGEVGAAQVGAAEVLPDEVGSSAVEPLAPGFGSHELAGTTQESIDVSSVCSHVQLPERVGTAVGEAFGLVEREAELTVERARRGQRQRFGQIPEQLMELAHDGEHLEHLRRDLWGPPPVLSAEGDLGDLLPGAEAVVDAATREALLPEAGVNGAAEVCSQIWAGVPGGFVDGEVCRG